MLYLLDDHDKYLKRHAGDPVLGYVFRNFINLKREDLGKPQLFGDDSMNPSILLAHYTGGVMVAGDPSLYAQVWRDIFDGEIAGAGIIPREMKVPQTGDGVGRRGLFCNSVPLAFWEAATQAGFKPDLESHVPARVWFLLGKPRFSSMVKFPCRLGVGDELVDLLVQGIEYDDDGQYVRQCVKYGPSFISEIDGEAVCWSATHMTGTLAMVYTPEKHRRKGYARSLGAFHIDYILEKQGMAVCHVIGDNFASEKMMASFGFEVIDKPLVWRSVYWPT